MGLFGPPNVERLEQREDTRGLERALKYQDDASIRCEAALALGRIGNRQMIGPLIDALKDEDKKVRACAADALGMMGDFQVFIPLLEAMKEQNQFPDPFLEAFLAISGKIGDPANRDQMIEAMMAVLAEGKGTATWVAAKVLKEMVEFTEDQRLVSQIGQLFLRTLESEDRTLRGYVLGGLGICLEKLDSRELSPEVAHAILRLDLLKDAGLRLMALGILGNLLGQIEDPGIFKSLRALLRHHSGDQRYEVRLECVKCLAKIGTEEELPSLAQRMIRDVNGEVQDAAVRAMATISAERSMELLLEYIGSFNRQEEEASPRKTNWLGAVQAMDRLGEGWVLEPLKAVAANSEFAGSPAIAAERAMERIETRI